MEKKYVGIVYRTKYNDDGNESFARCILVIKDFESIKQWYEGWAEDSGHKDDFSEENASIDISWEKEYDNDNSYHLCVVDDWNDDKQISKFRNVLKEWCANACECWQERDWDIDDCFYFKLFNDEDPIYDISEDGDIIHKEDGKYEHDLYCYGESSKSADYLFNIVDGLVKEQIGDQLKDPVKEDPAKEFINDITDKLLNKAMDKIITKIDNNDDLFDDTIINSIISKLIEKVSDQLNKRLGL